MKLAGKSARLYAMRQLPRRPSYLDYPYTSDEPGFSFWDDHKHQIWPIIIAAIITFGGYSLLEAIRHFTLFETLC
jgi:hypothetical protein